MSITRIKQFDARPPRRAEPRAGYHRRLMNARAEELFKTALQVLAIACLAAIVLVILHKGYADVSRLAREHSGLDFWSALARHVLRNLAGG